MPARAGAAWHTRAWDEYMELQVEKSSTDLVFAKRQFGRPSMSTPALMNPLVARLPPERSRSCDRDLSIEERLCQTREYSGLCYPVKWAMTVEILRMDDASAKNWFGLAWDIFVCAPAVPEVSLLCCIPSGGPYRWLRV